LLHRLIDTYTIEAGRAVREGELNEAGNRIEMSDELRYVENMQEALGTFGGTQ